MKEEHINEIKGIFVLGVGLLLLASFLSFVPEDLSWYTSHPNVPAQNWVRIVGAYIAGSLFFVLGYSSYFLAAFFQNLLIARHFTPLCSTANHNIT